MIAIIGPTASGKTALAAKLAFSIDGEIISADSRQVYKNMDIGTGKDYDDYVINNRDIPYHLINIVEPGDKYDVYQFQNDFLQIYNDIKYRKKIPVLCGGSGMYIEAVLKGYKLIRVPDNNKLRNELNLKSLSELIEILALLKPLHNSTDTLNRERILRAIEIETYYAENPDIETDYPNIETKIFGIKTDSITLKKRIKKRLIQRFDSGMIDEVRGLMGNGVNPEILKYYGLEYKYICMYLLEELNYNDMTQKLYAAICQFAKRQMTWFRKMERNGFNIHWIDGKLPIEDKLDRIQKEVKIWDNKTD